MAMDYLEQNAPAELLNSPLDASVNGADAQQVAAELLQTENQADLNRALDGAMGADVQNAVVDMMGGTNRAAEDEAANAANAANATSTAEAGDAANATQTVAAQAPAEALSSNLLEGVRTDRPEGVDEAAWAQWLQWQQVRSTFKKRKPGEVVDPAAIWTRDQSENEDVEEEERVSQYDPTPTNQGEIPTIEPAARPDPKVLAQFTGKANIEGMQHLNEGLEWNMEKGVWYAHTFDAYSKRTVKKSMPQHYWKGHADEKYFQMKGFYNFKLRQGESASEAIEAFFEGLTVCECYSAMIAIEYRTLLQTLGAEQFDATFGNTEGTVANTMCIEAGNSASNPLSQFKTSTDAAKERNSGEFGDRPAQEGEWYYFYNHPQYLLKHPAGAFQGENCFYMGRNEDGEQLWRGFGVENVTEQEMLEEMASAYNNGRSSYDKDRISEMEDQGYDVSIFDRENFASEVSWQEVLSADAYNYGGTTRKGGFVAAAGQTLDADAIADLMASLGIDIGGKEADKKDKDEDRA